MDEVILAEKAIKGDKEAFEKLINIYSKRLYKEIYIRCKYEEDAKEIFQETVYKAYKNIQKLKEPKYFKTWISKILINTTND
ncbi:sigma factor, partial [Romboutsia sp. 1001216sp1]